MVEINGRWYENDRPAVCAWCYWGEPHGMKRIRCLRGRKGCAYLIDRNLCSSCSCRREGNAVCKEHSCRRREMPGLDPAVEETDEGRDEEKTGGLS